MTASLGGIPLAIQQSLAFGNNPLNTSAISTILASQATNYLTFANGTTRIITAASLHLTPYELGVSLGPSTFTYGSTAQYSALQNYILLSAFK